VGLGEEKPALGRDVADRVREGLDKTGGIAQIGELGVVPGREFFDPRRRNGSVWAKGRMWVKHEMGPFMETDLGQNKEKREERHGIEVC
jgi:hypothetical protein